MRASRSATFPATGNFTSFTAQDWGGTDNRVDVVYIDAAGMKYFGTDSGVYRYAGA